MLHEPPPLCQDCGAPLKADGACLPCLFGEALGAGGPDGEGDASDGGFGCFIPQEAGAFGKYSLRRRIGSGGMGVIWEAEESVVRRVVALKMIRSFVFSSESDKLRFRTEATAAAQLDHPNIVPVYELGEVDGQPFFTMKLLDGDSLSKRLGDGAFPPREAAWIMEKLARAVQHAHARGVLHRDLKPGNVLFDSEGEPYVTDFGLAKLVDAEQALTLSNAQVGTPLYMSPEQARGRVRDVTTASDLWALGAMLYQMLTGRLPFPGTTPAEIFSRVVNDEPAPMRIRVASVDGDLETLCLRCLEKEPARRLPGAGELANELGRWLKGEPILSRRVSSRERALRWMRRHPWRVATGVALVLSLVIGTVVSLLLWRNAEESREKALRYAAAERLTAYESTLSAALAARERHDFSRARQLLASAPEEHRGLEWRLLERFCAGDQSSLFRLPGGEVPETLALGPDGESLAMVSDQGKLHVCDWDGKPLRPPRPLPEPASDSDPGNSTPEGFHGLLYAPGGRHFVCSFRNGVRVFDAETLEVIMERDNLVQVRSVWLDERRLLFGWNITALGYRSTGAWIFDTQDRRSVPLPMEFYAPFAVSADRSLAAVTEKVGSSVAVFRLADFAGAEPLKNAVPVARWRPRTGGWGNTFALSPDGKYLAALCGPLQAPAHTLEITELATNRPWMIQAFRETMTGLAFHPTEPQVALAGADAAVRLFHFLKAPPPGPATYDDDGPRDMREPVDGKGAHSAPHRLLTRTALEGRMAFLLGHEGKSSGVLFAPGGASLYSSSADGTVRIWPARAPEPAMRVKNAHVLKLGFYPSASPDGSRLLYADREKRTHYWREGKGFTRLAERHLPLAVLPEGRLATLEQESSDIILWQEDDDADTIRETGRIRGPGYIQGFDQLLRGLATHQGSKIVGALPGQLFVVDLKARKATSTGNMSWETGPSRKWDIAVSPDGRHIAATGLGHCTEIYDPEDLQKPPLPLGEFRNYDTAVAFHPDGSRLYCGNEDGRVRVFDTSNWTELPEQGWQAHRGAVIALAASHDARNIATAGDTTLKLWKVDKPADAARVELVSFTTPSPAAWLHFGRDADGGDRSLMLCPPYGPLEIWPCSQSPAGEFGPARTSVTRVMRAPQSQPMNAPGRTEATPEEAGQKFRLKASSMTGGESGGAYFLAFVPRGHLSSEEAEAIICKPDDASGTIMELTMMKGPQGAVGFRLHNFPPPEGKNAANMSAYLICRSDGRLVVAYRPDESFKRVGDQAHFAAHSEMVGGERSGKFLTLRSLFMPDRYMRHESQKVHLGPRDTSGLAESYDQDTTWGREPVPSGAK